MRSFTQKFTIHPIGQGLFYSGRIDINLHGIKEVYRFVYDCGSLTKDAGEVEVDRYRSEDFVNETDRLGLLVISHFDADHINKIKHLLADNRKVDNLVMPFMEFEERFFLVLRFLEKKDSGTSGDDLGTIRLMLNPLGELGPHLDGEDGGTVYLVTSDPDTPAGGEEGQSSGSDFTPDTPATGFGFKGRDQEIKNVDSAIFNLSSSINLNRQKLRTVKDSVTGDLHFRDFPPTQLMEFAFYRREASGHEKAFYRAVFNAFCKRFNIDREDPFIMDRLVEALQTITGAKLIKSLYIAARRTHPDVKVASRDILNMNTTALSMLHRNLKTVFILFATQYDADDYEFSFHTQRFDKISGLETYVYHPDVWYRFRYRHRPFWNSYYEHHLLQKILPNVLLTSDSYLKTQVEVDALFRKYGNYLDKYVLVQVPHHGSRNNADRLLLSRIPHYVSKFINYGIRHQFDKRYRHPDAELITELIASGHGHDVLAVTEYLGQISYFDVSKN